MTTNINKRRGEDKLLTEELQILYVDISPLGARFITLTHSHPQVWTVLMIYIVEKLGKHCLSLVIKVIISQYSLLIVCAIDKIC